MSPETTPNLPIRIRIIAKKTKLVNADEEKNVITGMKIGNIFISVVSS